MKKLVLLLSILFFFNHSAWADAKSLLQERLAKVEGFSARFTQMVTTIDNELVQDGKGELFVNRPYYFRWYMHEPDETSIISDGETVWIYTPMLEQVTASWVKDVADNRLLLLITDSQSHAWDFYQVERQSDMFHLNPTDGSPQKFIISVLPTGMIANFTIIEEDGQSSFYDLSHQKLGAIDKSEFAFTVPKGVELDDQRK